MKAHYSKPNSEKPWTNDRLILTSRRLPDGRERVHITRVHGLERVEHGRMDFRGYQERMAFFDQMADAAEREGWGWKPSGA